MKKILPLLCSLSLFVLPVSASPTLTVEQVITTLEIMEGDQNGNLNLTQTVKRSEFITMSVNLLLGKNQLVSPTTSPFPDVPRGHWAAPYVMAGVEQGLISGYSDGTFRPDNQITLGEAAVILPKLLGFTNQDFVGTSMEGRVLWIKNADLLENVVATKSTDIITRSDTMHLFYNLILADTKQGPTLIEGMGYLLNSSGEIDPIAFIESTMEGPFLAETNWKGQIPYTSAYTVSLNDKPSNESEIQENDVLYYSTSSKSVWAYRHQVTGSIGDLTSPNTVTLAGNPYTLETDEMIYALSSFGDVKKGDVVTALLGRNGGITFFLPPYTGASSVCGVVVGITTTAYSDGAGGSYYGPMVVVLGTDGGNHTFPISTEDLKEISVGDLVQVSVNMMGEIIITEVKGKTFLGVVSRDGTTVGDYRFAEDIEILDIYETQGATVTPQRLAGLTLFNGNILYYRIDAYGEIDRLILDDVTGEMYEYGVLVKKAVFSFGTSLSGNYQYVLGDGPGFLSTNVGYSAKEGPIVIIGALDNPDKMLSLVSAPVERFDATSALLRGSLHPYADNLVVLERQGENYYLSTLARIQDGSFDTFTGAYRGSTDTHIRVIIAEHSDDEIDD